MYKFNEDQVDNLNVDNQPEDEMGYQNDIPTIITTHEKSDEDEDYDQIYMEGEGGDKIILANFRPEIVEEIHHVYLDETRRKYKVRIIHKGKPVGNAEECTMAEWGRTNFYYDKFGVASSNIWYKGKSEERIKELVLEKRGTIPIRKEYHFLGRSKDGTVFVSEQLGVIDLSEKEALTEEEVKYLLYCLFKILPDMKMEKMVSFGLLAPAMTAFVEAGVKTPDFITYIQAPSGARKTTISSMVFCFNTMGKATMSFESTYASIDMKMKQMRDHAMVLDDGHPETGRQEAKEQRHKMELAVRVAGDSGSTRQKVYGGSVKADVAECLTVVNGEFIPEFTRSSDARVMKVTFEKEDVDTDVLSAAQEGIALYQSFFKKWIVYILTEGDLVKVLYEQVAKYNKRNQNEFPVLHPRKCLAYAWVQAVFECCMDFCKSAGGFESRLKDVTDRFAEHIRDVLAKEEWWEINENSPKKYLDAMMEMKERSKVLFVEINERSTVSIGPKADKAVLFFDRDFVYLRTDKIAEAVNQQADEEEITGAKLRAMLENDKVISRFSDGNLTKSKQINGKKYRVTPVRKALLEEKYEFKVSD